VVAILPPTKAVYNQGPTPRFCAAQQPGRTTLPPHTVQHLARCE
jgi:hypothetical protein